MDTWKLAPERRTFDPLNQLHSIGFVRMEIRPFSEEFPRLDETFHVYGFRVFEGEKPTKDIKAADLLVKVLVESPLGPTWLTTSLASVFLTPDYQKRNPVFTAAGSAGLAIVRKVALGFEVLLWPRPGTPEPSSRVWSELEEARQDALALAAGQGVQVPAPGLKHQVAVNF